MAGPIAPERNPPINPQYYQPSRFVISAITLASPTSETTTVTTSEDHNYVLGQLIRLLVPNAYGSTQISGKTGYVSAIPAANEVVVGINSTNCSAFIGSPVYGPTLPQILAVGDGNQGYINSTGRTTATTTIPGSFINISPL